MLQSLCSFTAHCNIASALFLYSDSVLGLVESSQQDLYLHSHDHSMGSMVSISDELSTACNSEHACPLLPASTDDGSLRLGPNHWNAIIGLLHLATLNISYPVELITRLLLGSLSN